MKTQAIARLQTIAAATMIGNLSKKFKAAWDATSPKNKIKKFSGLSDGDNEATAILENKISKEDYKAALTKIGVKGGKYIPSAGDNYVKVSLAPNGIYIKLDAN